MNLENPTRDKISLLIALILILMILLISCSKNENFNYSNDMDYLAIESDVFKLVNIHRIENNLIEYESLDIISEVAETHTDYMIRKDKLSHDNFDDRHSQLQNKLNSKEAGENVAYGYRTALEAFNGWLTSPAHRRLIESNNYNYFGICVKENSHGYLFFTQIFIRI